MSLPTTNGSEGDAYRYTKKVLLSLHNRSRLESIYTEVAENRGISSWTRAAYMDLRATFFRDGQCKIRFAPGVARIAFGELDLGTGDEEPVNICSLRDMIRIISIAHCNDYTRHLVNKDGVELNYAKMLEIYGTKATANWALLKRRLKRMKYGQRRYKIIELTDFQVASQYYKYTEPHGWCHLHYEDTFRHYHMVNSSRIFSDRDGTNCIRLYLAVLPGFEDMKDTDELYGESMLGIDIGPGGRLIHVNNRWNHDHDNIDERKGDNKYSEIELSMLLGGPFFEVCPPYSVSDENRQLRAIRDEARKHNAELVKRRIHLTRLSAREFGKIGKRTTKYTDPRDNATYGVRKYGKAKFTSTPLHYIPEGSDCIDLPRDWFDQCHKEDDTKHVYVLTIDPFNHNSLIWAENTSPQFNDLKQTAKKANPIGSTMGDSLSWLKYPDEDVKYYTSYSINEDDRPPTVCQKVELSNQTQYMILPVSKNRAIYKNPETGKLEAIRFKHCVHVPILFIGSTVISLHPAYNDLVKTFDNPVLFPDNIDEFTSREIVSATPVPSATSYKSSWTTNYTLSTNDPEDEATTIICGRKNARLIRRFVCDHIFGHVETAMAMEFPSCTAKDIDNVTHKLGLIFKDQTYREYSTLPDAPNKYRYESCWTGNPLEQAIINEINPEVGNTIVSMHGQDTADSLYDEVVQDSIDKPNHNILYEGITANGTRFKPIVGMLYLDLDYAKTAIDHIRPRAELDLAGLVDHLFLSVVTPVWQPKGFGYASTVVAETSSIPVSDVEATIYSIKSKPDSIIRIGKELCLYPNKLARQLENDTLRFPDANDIYSYLSAVGFKINEADLLPKSELLRQNETVDAEDDFRDMFLRHMRGLAHGGVTTATTEKPKPKKRGIKIPGKLASYFAFPTIRRQFDDATHLDAVHLGILFSTSNINNHMHRYAYIPEIIKEVNRLGLSIGPAKPNELHVEISRDSQYHGDQTSTNYLTVTVESPRFGNFFISSTKDVDYVMPYMVVKDVKKTA